MKHKHEPAIVVSPYQHLAGVLEQTGISHVISILGRSDKLEWPSVGARKLLRLEFDDTYLSSGEWIGPGQQHIQQLIDFSRDWAGNGTALVHCRAGSSRSSAGALICVAAIGRPDLIPRVLGAKSYFRPNRRMLELADILLRPSPALLEAARDFAQPNRTDEWGPAKVPIPPLPAL